MVQITQRKASLLVYLAAASAFMGAFSIGTMLVWTSPALPDLERPDSVPQVTDKNTQSWIGSSMTLGALVGGLISAPIGQRFGLRTCLLIYGIPFAIGWVVIFLAKSVTMIIVGRVLTGFCGGLVSGAAPSYVNDISTASVRGLLGTLFQIFICIGILVVNILGVFLSWNILALILMTPAVLMTLLMFFMPETPIFLMINRGAASASDSLRRLRIGDSDQDLELKELEEMARDAQNTEFSMSQIAEPTVYKPLVYSVLLMFFQQCSGVCAILFYAKSIFEESGSSLSSNTAAILQAAAQVVVTIGGGFVMDRLGRKMLLMLSGAGETLSLVIIGYYYLKNPSTPIYNATVSTLVDGVVPSDNTYGWVPVACLTLFIVAFSIGYGPVPWLMMPELTINSARSLVCSAGTASNWILAFLVTKEFDDLQKLTDKHGCFWIFGGVALLGIFFVAICLPETNGKTPQEIQRILGGDRYLDSYAKKQNIEMATY